MVSLPALAHVRNVSQVFSIRTEGTVATIAGTTLQGREVTQPNPTPLIFRVVTCACSDPLTALLFLVQDGEGPVASFFESVGIVVSPLDGRVFVSDAASCHIRRITGVPQVRPNRQGRAALLLYPPTSYTTHP